MSLVPFLALASASLYCISMIAMKLWWSGPAPLVGLIIVTTLLGAAAFEVAALRTERLGLIYAGILGAEVIILAVVSCVVFGESFSPREYAGIALVLIGTALAWA
jgi:multidrug transporter EmrE-like cation transporter